MLVCAGTNDLLQRSSVEDAGRAIALLVDLIRENLPATEIVLLGLPRMRGLIPRYRIQGLHRQIVSIAAPRDRVRVFNLSNCVTQGIHLSVPHLWPVVSRFF